MLQPSMRTLRQWSMSMPSQLGISRLFRIEIPSMCRPSQPMGWMVQVADVVSALLA
jgi:hypothetical protein